MHSRNNSEKLISVKSCPNDENVGIERAWPHHGRLHFTILKKRYPAIDTGSVGHRSLFSDYRRSGESIRQGAALGLP